MVLIDGVCWEYVCVGVARLSGQTYIANHAVLQRCVGGLIEFSPACDAYEVVLIRWVASCGDVARHVRVIERWKILRECGGASVALGCSVCHLRSSFFERQIFVLRREQIGSLEEVKGG